MIDKWKKAADSNKVFSAILTNLSKAFDCICPDLLIEKLHAYGLSLPALKVIQVHLLNRKQNWILMQYMGEYYIWCSSRINLRAPFAQHIFM